MFRIILLGIVLISLECVNTRSAGVEAFFDDFENGYKSLKVPPFVLSYSDNLSAIKSNEEIRRQSEFFENVDKRVAAIDRSQLSAAQKIDFDLIVYETRLNLERLKLETIYNADGGSKITGEGLSQIPNGKRWYAYFLRRWVDSVVTPDEMFEFGLSEIKRVKGNISEIKKRVGMSDEEFRTYINSKRFFYTDVKQVEKAFRKTKKKLAGDISENFPFLEKVPDLKIKRGTNQNLVQVPGFYRNGTFYFNFFDRPFNRRQVEWLYVHEGIPGHHYQAMVGQSLQLSRIKKMFSYSGYNEGWAAYVEDIGNEYGAYPDIYSELGKWEWDLIRSVRVPIDVGMNFHGWSDEKALEFWKQHITEQDDIGVREINRMKRWPAQVITYKYGAKKFRELKEKQQRLKGRKFLLKEFHRSVLKNGSLPMSVLEKHI